jgi:hypothetical protein
MITRAKQSDGDSSNRADFQSTTDKQSRGDSSNRADFQSTPDKQSRGERFDRADFQARADARSLTNDLPSGVGRLPVSTPSTLEDPAHQDAVAHLRTLKYSDSQIEELLKGPDKSA